MQVGTNGANPEHGVYHEYQTGEVKEGEYLVVASDGIWDNLKDFMIYQVVTNKKDSL